MDDDTTITPDEHEYIEKVTEIIISKVSSQELDALQLAALICTSNFTVFRAYILTLLAKGYMLRDEEDLYKTLSAKITADDFLDKK